MARDCPHRFAHGVLCRLVKSEDGGDLWNSGGAFRASLIEASKQSVAAVADAALGAAMSGMAGKNIGNAAQKPSASAPGKLIGSVDGLTAAEQSFAGKLVAGGRTVQVTPSSNAGRAAGFLIEGTTYELKTMTGVVSQTSDGLSKAISSTAMDARGQSPDIILTHEISQA